MRRHAGAGGTLPFNRPPRGARPGPGGEIEAPGAPRAPDKPHFSIATTLGPLVLAVVMVMVMKDLRFAMFAILSPMIALGTYFESKPPQHEGRRPVAGGVRGVRARVCATRCARRGRPSARACARCIPIPPRSCAAPRCPACSSGSAVPHHEDFLKLFAGLADVPWQPPVKDALSGKRTDEVRDVLAKSRLLAAPLMVDLSDGGVVGVVGDRTRRARRRAQPRLPGGRAPRARRT